MCSDPFLSNRIYSCNSWAEIKTSPPHTNSFLSTVNHKVRAKLGPVRTSNEYVLHTVDGCLLSSSLCYLEAKDKCSGITFKTIPPVLLSLRAESQNKNWAVILASVDWPIFNNWRFRKKPLKTTIKAHAKCCCCCRVRKSSSTPSPLLQLFWLFYCVSDCKSLYNGCLLFVQGFFTTKHSINTFSTDCCSHVKVTRCWPISCTWQ